MIAEPETDPLIPTPITPDAVAYAFTHERNQLYGAGVVVDDVITAVLNRCSNATTRDARMAIRRLELEGALDVTELPGTNPVCWALPMEQPRDEFA